MTDVQRAFMLLDIIQGHPGYGVNCYVCGRPMTNVFGEVLPDESPIVGVVGDRDGLRHDISPHGWCPYALFGDTV